MKLPRCLSGQPATPEGRSDTNGRDSALSSSLLESLLGMARVIEARDPCTAGHL